MFEENANLSNIDSDQNQAPLPPVDLTATGQPPVQTKVGRDLPGTEDIFAVSEKSGNSVNFNGPVSSMPPVKNINQTSFNNPPASMGPLQPLASLPDDLEDEGGKGHRFFWIGVVFLILILGALGYWAYGKFFASSGINLPTFNINSSSVTNLNKEFEDNIVNLNLNENQNVNSSEPTTTVPVLEDNPDISSPDFMDSDQDGLSDSQESGLGTNPNFSDSDNDGLSDREEVNVYHTNPLNPDSDGDGYADGAEVNNGYSPSGPGKLLNLNSTSTNP